MCLHSQAIDSLYRAALVSAKREVSELFSTLLRTTGPDTTCEQNLATDEHERAEGQSHQYVGATVAPAPQRLRGLPCASSGSESSLEDLASTPRVLRRELQQRTHGSCGFMHGNAPLQTFPEERQRDNWPGRRRQNPCPHPSSMGISNTPLQVHTSLRCWLSVQLDTHPNALREAHMRGINGYLEVRALHHISHPLPE